MNGKQIVLDSTSGDLYIDPIETNNTERIAMIVYRVLEMLGQERSVPICLDLEIRTKSEWQMARWLSTLPSFFYKPANCRVRVMHLGSGGVTLEILKNGE